LRGWSPRAWPTSRSERGCSSPSAPWTARSAASWTSLALTPAPRSPPGWLHPVTA